MLQAIIHPPLLRVIRFHVARARCCALLVLWLAACGESEGNAPSTAPSNTPAPLCSSAAAPGSVRVFAPNVGRSEGIAFLDAKLYIAGGDSIRSIDADGSATTLATVPETVGMVAWHGALYAASGSDGMVAGSFCAATNHGVIWKVTTD